MGFRSKWHNNIANDLEWEITEINELIINNATNIVFNNKWHNYLIHGEEIN